MKRLLTRFVLASLVALLLPPWQALAEQESEPLHVLDEIVVTATGKTKMLDTPASISVITAADLEKMGAKKIIEALERIPGVYNTSGSRSSLSVRGTRSSMAGGPVILVDGVAQRYGNYRRDELDIIPISQIERIEVLRSAGVAYGPGSSRGVINIITKKGQAEEPVAINASGSYGSWDTVDLTGSLSGRINQWDYYGDIAHFKANGYEQEKEDRASGLVKLGYNLSEMTRLGARGNWMKSDRLNAYDLKKFQWQLDTYRDKIHFPEGPSDPDIVWHNRKEQESAQYALDVSHKGERLFADATLSYTNYDEVYHDTKDIFYSAASRRLGPTRGDVDNREQDTYTLSLSGGYDLTLGSVAYTPVVGFAYEDVEYTQRRAYPYSTRSSAKYDLDLDEATWGLFWDNDFRLGEHWGVKIGTRIDRADLSFKNRDTFDFETDETMWSWSIAPSYHFSPSANLYISASRSYWYPSPQYFFWAFDYASPNNRPEDLKPEDSLTFEIGYKHRLNKVINLALTAYYMDTTDKFAGYYEGTSYMGQKNTGDADTYGLEMEINGRPLEWLGYRLSGAYIDAEWKSGTARIYEHPGNTRIVTDLDGYQIHGIPRFTGRIGLDFYPLESLKVSVDLNHWGDYDIDYANRLEYPSKTTVDACISYAWSHFKVWVLAKNLFDEKIERAINSDGELTGPDGDPRTAYYVQDGLYLETGLSVAF